MVEALLVCQFIFYTLGVAGYLKLPIPFSGVIFSFIFNFFISLPAIFVSCCFVFIAYASVAT
ncbi:MAG: hypothetical protein ACKVH9_10080, partial [Rhodobacterales bacterium]